MEPRSKHMLIQYSSGFILSLILTITAYLFVTAHVMSGMQLIITISILAFIQMMVQLVLFLHVGIEDRPRLKLVSLLFMATVLIIIVGGSLWIMNHLNYNMMHMSPDEKIQYMTGEKDKGF